MMHTTKVIYAMCCTPLRLSLWFAQRSSPRYVARYVAHRGDNFVIEYRGEIETEFENTYFRLFIRGQMGSNHEKNRGEKSCDTFPLTHGKRTSVIVFKNQNIFLQVCRHKLCKI